MLLRFELKETGFWDADQRECCWQLHYVRAGEFVATVYFEGSIVLSCS